MAQESITVMVCDRCGKRLELRGSQVKTAEYQKLLREASRWQALRFGNIGGDHEWLLCPDDWANQQAFIAGSGL